MINDDDPNMEKYHSLDCAHFLMSGKTQDVNEIVISI